MTVHGAILLAVVTLAAFSPGPNQAARTVEPLAKAATPATVAGRATAFTSIDLGACLAIARKAAEPSEALWPGLISRGLVAMISTCADVGGRLEPAERPALALLDVNGA